MNTHDCVAELLKLRTAAAMVHAASQMERPTGTREELKTALDAMTGHLTRNRHHDAVATILAMLLVDADGVISKMRRMGVLRASRYKFQISCLDKVVDAALTLAPSLQIRPERIAYLESVRALLALAPQARRIRESLVLRLRNRKSIVMKSLLALVNTVFSKNWMGNRNDDSDSLTHWSAEELAAAFAQLFVLHRDEIGIVERMWQHTDEQCVNPFDGIYTNLFLDAAKLNEINDAETLIDGLPYRAKVDGETVTVSAIDPDFEKSIRLGYIQTDQQVAIRAIGVARARDEQSKALPSIQEFIRQAFGAGMGELVQLKTAPIARLVFSIPESEHFFAPLSTDQLFLDEVAMLYGASIENFHSEAGPALRINDKLTALDVIKVQRLFSFVDAVFGEKLQTYDDKKLCETLRVRSTLPVIRHDKLCEVLERVLTKEKVEEALKLLTLQGDEEYVDIQYRPLIKVDNSYIVAPAVVAKSNLVRNVVTSNRLRTSATLVIDPMQEAVVDALTRAAFMVRPSFTFNMKGDRETDIMCWRNGELFVFECKNSYHPCSPHELRTSFEHIKTAEKQLDIRLAWLSDAGNQVKILKWLGWDVPATQKVHTGIITANRAFTGYRLGDHPVRQAHELINVLLRGYVACTEGPPLRFWRDESFQAADLVDYLQGQAVVEHQYALLQPVTRRVKIGLTTLAFENYMMDLQEAVRATEKAYGASISPDGAVAG